MLETSNKRSGRFNVSFGTKFKDIFEVQVVTDKCCVTIHPTEVLVKSEDPEVEKLAVQGSYGVVEEMKLFAEAVERKIAGREGDLDARISTAEALADLEMLEAMLRSGEAGGAVQKLR